jgi:hypothetical protein
MNLSIKAMVVDSFFGNIFTKGLSRASQGRRCFTSTFISLKNSDWHALLEIKKYSFYTEACQPEN